MEQVKKRRPWRDMGLRPAYVLYTLAAFAAATALYMTLSRCVDRARLDICRRYRDADAVQTLPLEEAAAPEGVSYVVLYGGDGGGARIFSAGGRSGLSEGGEGASVQLVPAPSLSGGDRTAFLLLGGVQLLLVPACYGGGAVLCAALFYRRRLAGALRLLEDASGRIAAGRLDFTVGYGREDEMGRLCRCFETMRSALLESQRATWRQMEERGRLNAALSHDLRTPLTVLKGHAGMLLSGLPRGELTEEEVLEEVRVMSLHIDRLESYVEAMARLRRLEDVAVRRGPTDSGALLAALADTAEILRGDRELVWTVHGRGSWNVDGEIVIQVCENLLTNAFRHSRKRVEASVSAEGDALCVVVSDDGQGFSRRALERAMEPFYQDFSGGRMGMGLHICKLLCERHGGSLSICNNAKGGALVCASFGF